jgi:GNAT superfamily N-acetyltransferase
MLQRLCQYYRQHGFADTARRIGTALRRLSYAGKNVVFVCELPVEKNPTNLSDGVLERKSNLNQLTAADMERIVSPADSDASRQRMSERFEARAELWLVRCSGVVAVFGWTIAGKTMEPHFVQLTAKDVHLFDFFVFPEFRGRGLNPALVEQILHALSRENLRRAFIEAAAWNAPQLASLKKTSFRRLGAARQFRVGKISKTFWSSRETLLLN